MNSTFALYRTEPLRVLLVTARYLPYMGGIETHVYEVARRLAKFNVDTTVLTTDPKGQAPSFEYADGVKIRRVPARPRDQDYYFAPEIYHIVREGNWDVVHCQGVHTFVPPLTMLACRRAKLPFVVTFHTGGHSSRLRNAIRSAQWTMLRPLLARAKRFIAVSKYEQRFFSEWLNLPSAAFDFIPNGSDLPHIEKSNSISRNEPLIISVGRLERFKGHQRVIAALPYVLEQSPHARLVILGSGPYEAELRQRAREANVAERVEFKMIPAGERARMAETLAGASLVTLLSDAESNPVAIMEALALGRPALVTNTSGLSELAERGLARAIPLESTPVQVARAMLEQLEDPLIPGPVELPTWQDCTRKLLAIYQAVAN